MVAVSDQVPPYLSCTRATTSGTQPRDHSTPTRGLDYLSADAEELAKALQSSAAQNALQGMVQSRLTSLIGKSSGYVESLPVEVKRSLAALQAVQTKQTELQNQFKREVWELEKKVRHFVA